MIEVESISGHIHFDGQTITIKRTSRIARSVFGDTTTVIPVGHIGAVEWAEPHWYQAGHIRFAVAGTQASAIPTPVNRDQNACLFGKKERDAFEKLRLVVQDAISQ